MTEQDYRVIPYERPQDGIHGYIDGVAITDDVIARLNASAETGHPGVTARPVGHPVQIGEEPAVVVQFRIDKTKLEELDRKAKAEKRSRSDLLRCAVDRELLAA